MDTITAQDRSAEEIWNKIKEDDDLKCEYVLDMKLS
jgi:hypothetical protein